MSVVVKTEEAFLISYIAEINCAKEGNLQNRVPIDKSNFGEALVVLLEPPRKVIKLLQAQGVDTRGVFSFEVEGRYCLPKVDTQHRMEAIFNEIEVFPSESKF